MLIAGASVWLFHGLVDWLWEMPVLSVLGMALVGAACGLAPHKPQLARAHIRNRIRRLAITGFGVVVTAVATTTIALPWFAQRDIQRAIAIWPTDTSGAFSILQRAHELDPLSNKSDVLAGAIADRLHRYDLMRTRYRSAVERSPDDWYANLELGDRRLTDRRPSARSDVASQGGRAKPP